MVRMAVLVAAHRASTGSSDDHTPPKAVALLLRLTMAIQVRADEPWEFAPRAKLRAQLVARYGARLNAAMRHAVPRGTATPRRTATAASVAAADATTATAAATAATAATVSTAAAAVEAEAVALPGEAGAAAAAAAAWMAGGVGGATNLAAARTAAFAQTMRREMRRVLLGGGGKGQAHAQGQGLGQEPGHGQGHGQGQAQPLDGMGGSGNGQRPQEGGVGARLGEFVVDALLACTADGGCLGRDGDGALREPERRG